MRPHVDETAVEMLRQGVPEFEPCYLDLVDIYDEDLTPHAVFTELADFVANLLDDGDPDEVVEKVMCVVETIAGTPGLDLAETIGFGFLDGLRPDILAQLVDRFGPATERVLEDLEAGELELLGESLSVEDLADIDLMEAQGLISSEEAMAARGGPEPS